MRLEKRKNHTLEAIVDRIILKPYPTEPVADGTTPPAGYDTRRLSAAVASALQLANGLVLIGLQAPNGKATETLFSSSMACPECGINVAKLEPRSFSFNSTYGACPECHGLGSIYDFDPAKTISDWSKPLLDGAMGPGSASQYLLRLIKLAADKYKINLKQPFSALTKDQQQLLLYGPPRNEVGRTGFHGILNWLRDTLEDTKSEGYREYMMQYMSATECPRCHGRRLRPESLAVTLPLADAALHPPSTRDETEPIEAADAKRDASIADFTALSLERALQAARSMAFSGREHLIADRLQREIIERLEFLNAVGLGYISLDRSAATLSGGEGQRIRLATQIGSRLRGVLYVLDEPSIGLHQRDNQRLIAALEDLRDLGNTVLVVEHDEDTIRKADYVLDLGPGAGKNGGHIMASGTPAEIMANPNSVTGQYLAGHIDIVTRPTPGKAPRPLDGRWLSVQDATLAQPATRDSALPARRHDRRLRRQRLRQEHAGQRHPLPLAGQGAIRFARRAGRAQGHSRGRSIRQGDPDRPVAHRPHAALEPPQPIPASSPRSAICLRCCRSRGSAATSPGALVSTCREDDAKPARARVSGASR